MHSFIDFPHFFHVFHTLPMLHICSSFYISPPQLLRPHLVPGWTSRWIFSRTIGLKRLLGNLSTRVALRIRLKNLQMLKPSTTIPRVNSTLTTIVCPRPSTGLKSATRLVMEFAVVMELAITSCFWMGFRLNLVGILIPWRAAQPLGVVVLW